jgi:hypothetical protein
MIGYKIQQTMLAFLYFVSLLRHQITNEILLQDAQLERGAFEQS